MNLFVRETRTRLAGGRWYDYQPGWLGLPDPAFAALRQELQWRQYHTKIAGVRDPIPYPRLECWYVIGDPIVYSYGGVDHHSLPLVHPVLGAILRRLRREHGYHYNACFANLYRSGSDSIGWHADDEPALGPVEDVQIAAVSLGATRAIELRRTTDTPASAVRVDLEAGSLFTMGPGLQKEWLHQVPKQREIVGERIALTFRQVFHG